MSKLVFVYSIHLQDSATGLSNFVSPSSGIKLKKRKMGRCTDVISALYSPKVGGLGNYISYTPYVDPKTGITKIGDNGEPVMMQEMLEKKWNRSHGNKPGASPNISCMDHKIEKKFQKKLNLIEKKI